VIDQLGQREVESALQEPLKGGRVRCNTCNRRCEVEDGKTGWCSTRMVTDGRLVVLTLGQVSSLSSNPIEKKPLYHFYPGSYALTAGSWGCNFSCPWCQNWSISKTISGEDRVISAKDFVAEAVRRGCQGTSISFNEPTLSLEWALEVFQAARSCRPPLYNTFVSNGYMTTDALRLLAKEGLDALNVDVKGDADVYRRHCQADVEQVWQTCNLAMSLGMHLEITTLVIPGVNDEVEQLRRIARRIVQDLGPDIPWHVNAYFPAHEFSAPPTPAATLARAYQLGRKAGVNFVYVGNLEGIGGDTRCPGCNALLVERAGLTVVRSRLSS
jgi:pyruvate formate lyase activating enzyme